MNSPLDYGYHPFFNRYRIYKNGSVFSEKRGRYLAVCTDRKGYTYTNLYNNNGKQKKRYVHRLVAEVFLGMDKSLQVNHIDGNKANNNIINLEYCTGAENVSHAFAMGLNSNLGSKNPRAFLSEDIVLEIRKMHDNGLEMLDIAKMFNVTKNRVWQIITRKNWSHL